MSIVDPTAPSTRERLLATAMRLFWEKGYNSTSVADILREAEANSGSLYHFFPTKQDVLVAVLEQYRDGIEPMLLQPVWDGVDDPIEKVFALLHGYRRLLLESDFRLGCPIGNIALEIAEPDPVVRTRLVQNFESWVAAVKACFDEAGPRIPPGTDTKHLARFCLVNMEGGVMLARAYREIEPFDDMVTTLRDYLQSLGVVEADPETRRNPQGGRR